jgi:uncharacterized membrane protein YkvA (DUF1232 family)
MTSATKTAAGSPGEAGRFALFVDLFKTWLLNFEVNSQFFVEIMNDEELPLAARTLAVGILAYVLSPIDLIPEKIKALRVVALLDDVVIMIIGQSIIVPLMPESRREHYKLKYEAVAQISDYEETLKAALGILWDTLVQFVENMRKRSFKKQTAEEIASSSELREDLFDETMIYVANLNLDPATLDQELKALPSPEKVIGLLAGGVEESQKRREKVSIATKSRSVFKRMLPPGKESTE